MRYALELTDTEFDLRKIKDKLPTSLTELSDVIYQLGKLNDKDSK